MNQIHHIGQFTRHFADDSPYDEAFQSVYDSFLKKIHFLNEIESDDVYWEEFQRLVAIAKKLSQQFFTPALDTLIKEGKDTRFLLDLREEVAEIVAQYATITPNYE